MIVRRPHPRYYATRRLKPGLRRLAADPFTLAMQDFVLDKSNQNPFTQGTPEHDAYESGWSHALLHDA